jgi:hypothetical protein
MSSRNARSRKTSAQPQARARTAKPAVAASPSRPAAAAPPQAAVAAEIKARAAADERLTDVEVEPFEVPDADELKETWTQFKKLESQLKRDQSDSEKTRKQLERVKENLDKRAADLDTGTRELGDERAEQEARIEALDRREEDVAARERDAGTGFAKRREQLEADLRTESAQRRAAEAEVIAEEREHWRQEWAKGQHSVNEQHAELLVRQDSLSRRERELAEELAAAKIAQEAAEQAQRFAQELAQKRAEMMEREVMHRTGEALTDRDAAERRAERLEHQNAEMTRVIAEHDAARFAVGGLSLPEAASQLHRLRAESDELRVKLDDVPRLDLQRLQRLESDVQTLSESNEDLLRENGSLNAIVQRESLSVSERESYAQHNAGLKVLNKTLQAHVDELRREREGLLASAKDATQFPECSRMDDEYGEWPDLDQTPPDLEQLTLTMQLRLRYELDRPLSYDLRHLRLVLGGLSMSRLHLYQGISGIGKTGLACGLAAALGSPECFAVVPVQAGWRDPQDLVGYYNSFDRLFYESEFTKALYKAQCPQFAGRPYFIVLDEMNLSHPEQYFSGVLSALERGSDGGLALTTARIKNSPRLLRDGTHLNVPSSVWFVGTANHDETTVGFADKTYDRSFVLELPHHHPEVEPGQLELVRPLSLEALQRSFDIAMRDHMAAADEIKAYFAAQWKDRLAQDLRIGWGNRLDQQIERFAPVVRAAGGGLGEAADHLMATRILRMVRGRYDIHAETLRRLAEDIETGWELLDDECGPTATTALLAQEMKARGGA